MKDHPQKKLDESGVIGVLALAEGCINMTKSACKKAVLTLLCPHDILCCPWQRVSDLPDRHLGTACSKSHHSCMIREAQF